MFRIALLLFLSVTIPGRANLGETVEQCVARYGTPVGYSEAGGRNPFGTVAFSAGGYSLVIFVLKNKEVGARVSKIDQSDFTEVERQTIMGADSAAGPWVASPSTDPASLQWSRSDKASALYDKARHVLIFTAPEMAAALPAK